VPGVSGGKVSFILGNAVELTQRRKGAETQGFGLQASSVRAI
jgi:hypothetical protein